MKLAPRGAVVLVSPGGLYRVVRWLRSEGGVSYRLEPLEGQSCEITVAAWACRVVERPLAEYPPLPAEEGPDLPKERKSRK